MSTEAEKIAAKLSEAQQRYLTVHARPSRYLPGVLVSYPPSNTHGVLVRLGLQEAWGDITPLGLEVRDILRRPGLTKTMEARRG